MEAKPYLHVVLLKKRDRRDKRGFSKHLCCRSTSTKLQCGSTHDNYCKRIPFNALEISNLFPGSLDCV